VFFCKFERHSSKCLPALTDVGERALRAARANRVSCTDEKRIRTGNTVIEKSNNGQALPSFTIASLLQRRGPLYHRPISRIAQ
jgi:hypothetical protein